MNPRLSRLIACVTLIGAAMLAAGCSDDDSSSGGSKSKIAPPPTARPSFAGMSTVINASGGDAISGNNTGAAGGLVQVISFQGNIKEGAASSPSINANFLAPALALGNTITFTQLAAIDPTRFGVTAAGDARVDLFGQDFFLPASATLDLSDAPTATVSTLVVFTHGVGDFIRIDGNVVTGRATAGAVGLQFMSGTCPGISISVNGTIDTRGAAGESSGIVHIQAYVGSVSLGGTIDASSVSAPTPGICGNVALFSNLGNVHLAFGQVVANGGTASGLNIGGPGGFIAFAALGDVASDRVRWGLRANGGSGVASRGGAGGLIQLVYSGHMNMFTPMEANGGSSTGEDGGNGGNVFIMASVLRGVATASASGGSASNAASFLGGNGGKVQVCGTSLFQSCAIEAVVSGGSGHSGGDGGQLTSPPASTVAGVNGIVDQILIDVTSNGGTGVVSGGTGGEVTFVLADSGRNVTVDAEVQGGNATGASGVGGDGGLATFGVGIFGHQDKNLHLIANANGGSSLAGTLGGNGGTVRSVSGTTLGIAAIKLAISGSANGGDSAGTGGNGGLLFSPGLGIVSMDFVLAFTANGGASGVGTGGTGGLLQLGPIGIASSYLRLTGSFTARGGVAQNAAAAGGTGGSIELRTPFLSGTAEIRGFDADLTGADHATGNGGNGGEVTLAFRGTTTIQNSTFITSGGRGSTVSGIGIGGNGGQQTIGTEDFDMTITGSIFRANGGNGRAGGGNGAVSALTGILFTTTLLNNSPAAALFINATVEANGGAALVSGDGGDAGTIGVDQNENVTFASFAAVTELRGTWLAIGGAGIANGGTGGVVTISSTGDNMTVNAIMNSNGGTGANGGDGGFVVVMASDSTATGTIAFDLTGTLSADGGIGTAQGGTGGLVAAGGDDVALTIRGTLTVNGGSGTVGGDAGQIQCVGFVASAPTSITVTASARLRANGGSANGNGGIINLDPQGTGGLANPNYTEQAGSVIEANANGTGTAGTITRD